MEVLKVSFGRRTVRLMKNRAILSDRYSEFPVNRDSMFSVVVEMDGLARTTRRFPEVVRFLRADAPLDEFLQGAKSIALPLAIIFARLANGGRILGEDAVRDEHMRELFALQGTENQPQLCGSSLIFVQRVWRSPDNLVGECEQVRVSLDSGEIQEVAVIPQR